MNRCSGDCCRTFVLSLDLAALTERAERDPEAAFIRAMVIDLGLFDVNPSGAVLPQAARYYTCRHFDDSTGDCRVYDDRPAMCRDYPGDQACEFPGCTWDAVRPTGVPDVMLRDIRRRAHLRVVFGEADIDQDKAVALCK